MAQLGTPFDHFLKRDYTTPTKEEQISYLKKHEEEMTDFVMSENPKVTSVQWDWESLETQTGGGPITSETWLNITAKFNGIKDSSLTVQWPLKNKQSFPKIKDIFLSQPLRVDGGAKPYE